MQTCCGSKGMYQHSWVTSWILTLRSTRGNQGQRRCESGPAPEGSWGRDPWTCKPDRVGVDALYVLVSLPPDQPLHGKLLEARALSSKAGFDTMSDSSEGYSGRGGQSRNPYNLTESPGGSSSGSAAAVACNMCPVALGTETDGSVCDQTLPSSTDDGGARVVTLERRLTNALYRSYSLPTETAS